MDKVDTRQKASDLLAGNPFRPFKAWGVLAASGILVQPISREADTAPRGQGQESQTFKEG